MLEQYFGGNQDSLATAATILIDALEPTFKSENQPAEPDSITIADIGFEQVYKSENHYFSVRDNSRIFAYKFTNQSENTIILIHGVASSTYLYDKTVGLLQEANTSGDLRHRSKRAPTLGR